jgi:hypothetical protein
VTAKTRSAQGAGLVE